MEWAVPSFSKSQVNRAGDALREKGIGLDIDTNSLNIINNWRASHQYPLNTIQMSLRKKAASVCDDPYVSQRIKRLPSVYRKLSFGTMKLAQMQDIGGCRAVVPSISSLHDLVEAFKSARFDHELINSKDYVAVPKDDGYRSIHLVYRYAGRGEKKCYDGLQIEIQLRTKFQHCWATAVESASTFTKQALKWRGGSIDWQRFFELSSAVLAYAEGQSRGILEDTPIDSIKSELRELSARLNALTQLRAYSVTLDYFEKKKLKSGLALLELKPAEGRVQISMFRVKDSQLANDAYIRREIELSDDPLANVVLVKVDSIAALRRSYPNYFLDTEFFVNQIKAAVRSD